MNSNRWLADLRDESALARILVRVQRLEAGNPGDARDVGEGVSEMRIDYGPGYRLYYKRIGREIFLLLCGGEKGGQSKDIRHAKKLASELRGK